jgi:DNA-binding NarL/FixJ family response regulator
MKYLDIKIIRRSLMPERSIPRKPLRIDPSRTAERMTPRELEVLARMAAGLSNRAIAADLGIGYTTVRGHVQALLEKLDARSRIAAVARAYRSGLVRNAEDER